MQVEVPRLRASRRSARGPGPTSSAATAPAARRGTSGCRCTRCRRPSRRSSTGMPPSDVTQSTSSSASPFELLRSGSMSLRTPVDVSACTTAITFGLGCAASERLGVDRLAPLGLDPHDLGPAARRRRRTSAAPNTPLTPTTTTSPGLDDVDERRLHAGRARAADREASARWPCGTPCRNRSQVSSRIVEELGIEMAEHRPRERLDDLGIGVARTGAHEDAIDRWAQAPRHATDGRRRGSERVVRSPNSAASGRATAAPRSANSAAHRSITWQRHSSTRGSATSDRATSPANRATSVTSPSGSARSPRSAARTHETANRCRSEAGLTAAVRCPQALGRPRARPARPRPRRTPKSARDRWATAIASISCAVNRSMHSAKRRTSMRCQSAGAASSIWAVWLSGRVWGRPPGWQADAP